jgi:hypothetical protein
MVHATGLRTARRLLTPEIVYAHSGTTSYVYVIVDGSLVKGSIQYPIADLNDVLGVDLPQQGEAATAALEEHLPRIEAYALAHVAIADDAGPRVLDLTGHEVLEHHHGSYGVLHYRSRGRADTPRRLTITSDGIVADKPHHEVLVVLRTYAGIGRFRTQRSDHLPLDASNTTLDVALPAPSATGALVGAGTAIGRGVRRRLRR